MKLSEISKNIFNALASYYTKSLHPEKTGETIVENPNNYDPANIQKYCGVNVVTGSGSHYGITLDGKFTGRPSIEGASVALVAGVEPQYWKDIANCLNSSRPELKERLDELIHQYGQEIRPGLHLVVSLTPEFVERRNRFGIITSPIQVMK